MKTAELIGAKLDYWVAKCKDLEPIPNALDGTLKEGILIVDENGLIQPYSPSTDWAPGGPLIERWEIGLIGPTQSPCKEWQAAVRGHPDLPHGYGNTALIAAMRAIVFSKFGDEVPEEPCTT